MAKLTRAQRAELDKFNYECDRVLEEKTFDEEINEEAYRIAHSLTVGGSGEICNHCMYKDCIKKCCLASRTQRVRQRLCWKANNRLILKKAGLYGQKRNP